MENKPLNEQFISACRVGESADVLKLLALGADPNLKNDAGYPVLGLAAWAGKTENCLALLDHGADLEGKDNRGESPLALAAMYGHTKTALALIDKKANLESKNKDSQTPLALAAVNRASQICVALVANGANVWTALASKRAPDFTDLITGHLKFPLHGATIHGMTKEIGKLLDLGYNADQKNDQGLTPVEYAEKFNQNEPASALRSLLARRVSYQTMREMPGIKP